MRATSMVLLCGLLGACGSDEGEGGDVYNPTIVPGDFQAAVDNPFWPLPVGATWRYEGGGETIDVVVTSDTRTVMGVTTVVVKDTVSEEGSVIEDTSDWYAQDSEGNVWYFGEDTKEYEDGDVVSTEGSWEADKDGAKPGIVMHENQPPAGEAYRQEYYPGEAEDMAAVLSENESVTVPYGSMDGCLKTREWTPLEPDVEEHKYYCPGIGLVLEVDADSGARVELVEFVAP